jgi:hypothetical protein
MNTRRRNRMRCHIGGMAMVVCCVGWAVPASAQCQGTEYAELTASDPQRPGQFGRDVDVDGTTAVVGRTGASGEVIDEAAYVFELTANGTTWTQVARLTASDGVDADLGFGIDVAISGDLIFVGAVGATGGCPKDPECTGGGVYIFARPAEGWADATETWKITASDTAPSDAVGANVAADGDVVAVGNLIDDFAGTNSGAVYIFRFDGTTWNEEAQIVGDDTHANDFFGDRVDIYGETLVVGAREHDHGATTTGGAYVFQRNQGGPNAWGQMLELIPSDQQGGQAFGWSVAVDADTITVGARRGDNGTSAGSVYVFDRNLGGPENWGEVVKLDGADTEDGDRFGWSVDVAGDLIAVGAMNDDEPTDSEGSAYVFMRDMGGPGAWGQAAKLTASNPTLAEHQGASVAIGDGVLLSGAPDRHSGVGSVYAYHGIGDCNGDAQLDLCGIVGGQVPDDNGNGFPDACECPCDCAQPPDGVVNVIDLLFMLSQWGGPGSCDCAQPPDGVVNVIDLLFMLGFWGPCPI